MATRRRRITGEAAAAKTLYERRRRITKVQGRPRRLTARSALRAEGACRVLRWNGCYVECVQQLQRAVASRGYLEAPPGVLFLMKGT